MGAACETRDGHFLNSGSESVKTSIRTTAAAAAILFVSGSAAQEPDYYDEISEWVFEPCMEVAAAFVVDHISAENRDLGTSRKLLAESLMLKQRGKMEEAVAIFLQGGAERWEDRRQMYPSMLRICLNGILREDRMR